MGPGVAFVSCHRPPSGRGRAFRVPTAFRAASERHQRTTMRGDARRHAGRTRHSRFRDWAWGLYMPPAFFCDMNVHCESHHAPRQHEHNHTLPRPPAHQRHGLSGSATYTLNHAPWLQNDSNKHRAEREHPRRDRAVAAESHRPAPVDGGCARALGQGHAAHRHRTVTLSSSHADDSACTLMSPAASGCPTAAHVTLPHASGVMSLDRVN